MVLPPKSLHGSSKGYFFLKFKLLYYKSQYEIYILFNDDTKAVQLYVKK